MRRNPGHTEGLRHLIEDAEYRCPDLLSLFEEDYPASANNTLKKYRGDRYYYGRNVVWVGEKGRMIRVSSDYAQHISGNIFDPCKLAAIVAGIKNLPHRVKFFPGYCELTVVGLLDVKESIEYQYDDELDEPLSTGNEELDEYLVDPDSVLDGYENREEEKKRLDAELQEALDNGDGDLGAIVVQVRDGNHRVFGSLLAGEPYVYLLVSDNQMQDLKKRPNDPDNKVIRAALE